MLRKSKNIDLKCLDKKINTFEYLHNENRYTGKITGIMILRDIVKYHFSLSVYTDQLTIWIDEWILLENIRKDYPNIVTYNIEVESLLNNAKI